MGGSARRAAVAKAAALVALLVGGWALVQVSGVPDADRVRDAVQAAGWWGPVAFVGGYAVWSLLPAPKNVVTALAAALFGFLPGAAVAWTGAMIGATVAFWAGRGLGRELVDTLVRGRLERIDALLRDHGFGAVLLVRLVPVVPFTAVNYGAGVTGISFPAYLLGTAVGMIPGTVAYATFGAFGLSSPTRTGTAVAALVLLCVGGWWVARRVARVDNAPDGTAATEADKGV